MTLCSVISRFGREDVEISDAEILEEYIKNSTLFPFFGFGSARNPERTSIDVRLDGVSRFLRDVELLHDSSVHCGLPTVYLHFLILYN